MRATVVGVDVGGPVKGFHAVALRGTRFLGRVQSTAPAEIRDWCLDHGAVVVGVDAPCRFRKGNVGRAAERDLAAQRLHAFATPSREAAERNRFYGWMLNGAALYAALEPAFPLYQGERVSAATCFETFPQAVACALAGRVLAARNKCVDRRRLLEHTGLDTRDLPNIDFVDAALCAVAASHVYAGTFSSYGERASGFIFVPKTAVTA